MKEVADFFVRYQQRNELNADAATLSLTQPRPSAVRPALPAPPPSRVKPSAPDLAACKTQIITPPTGAPRLVPVPPAQPGQPQAPPVLGVLLACMLGLLLTSMAAWVLAPSYP